MIITYVPYTVQPRSKLTNGVKSIEENARDEQGAPIQTKIHMTLTFMSDRISPSNGDKAPQAITKFLSIGPSPTEKFIKMHAKSYKWERNSTLLLP